jgi:uncharacterized protein YcgI (DUF1989 family)
LTIHPGHGGALLARKGEAVVVTDVRGRQIVDIVAYNAEDIGEFHSAEHTRVSVNRLFPKVGQAFVSNRRRPMLTLERDDSPGVHDMLIAACDPERYRLMGFEGYHANCRDSLRGAMAELGHPDVYVPAPINMFMNNPILEDGSLGWAAGLSRQGDKVVLRAETDVIVCASPCPQDLIDINGGEPTEVSLEVLP